MRIVVDLVGEAAHGRLAESRFVDRPFLPGGEHNMYELAFAGAAIGFDVELRGWLERHAFERLAHGTGAAPRVNVPARRPEPDDLVIVPEGWQDPLDYLRLMLSPAALAMFVLAPPGLFGWPFTQPGWRPPDPLTVPLDSVAKPDHFRAIHRLGFSILTHSPGIVAAAQAAGVPCSYVGTGRPHPPVLGDEAKSVDVAAVMANRWAPLVCEVADDLNGLSVDLIGECSNEELLARLGRARILLWPSRIEGHATIPWEARSVGCVPVALCTNRFAVGLSDDEGAVLVDGGEQFAPTIRALLADEPRWRELSARALRRAPAEVQWEPYVARVGNFLSTVSAGGPEREASWAMGDALRKWEDARAAKAQESLEEISAEEQRVRADRDRLAQEYAELAQMYAELRDRRAVKVAVGLDALRRRRQP